MGFSAGSSESSSTPIDMQAKQFRALRGPYASVFASLLGFGAPGGPSNGTGWGPNPSGKASSWVYNPTTNTYGPAPVSTTNAQPTGAQFGGSGGGFQNLFSGGGTGAKLQPRTVRSGSVRQGTAVLPEGMESVGGKGIDWGALFGGNQQQPQYAYPTSGDPNDILNGIPQYRGQLTANLGANEQALLDMLMGQATGGGSGSGSMSGGPNNEALAYLSKVMGGEFMPDGATPGGMSAFTQMLKGSSAQPGYKGTMEEMNPFLNAAITSAQRPTMQSLQEQLERSLPGRFTEAGQFKQPGSSSAFDRAGAIATRGAADAMADIATNLSYASYEAERGRTFEAEEGARSREDAQMKSELDRLFQGREGERGRQNEAAGLTSTIQASEIDNLTKNLQAQALPRLIQEFGIERGLEQFNNRMNSLLATLGIVQGVTAPVIGNKQESSSSQFGIQLA